MKRLAGVGVVLAFAALSGAAARAGPAGGQPRLALVREGSRFCVDAGPVGSQPPTAIFPLPAPTCPPVPCPSAESGTTTKQGPARPKSTHPTCPPQRVDAIYLVGADGRDPRRFATGVEPAWSSDGSELAYSTGRFLAIQKVDGSSAPDTVAALPEALAAGWAISDPSWSPGGGEIVFSVFETNPSLTGDEWREQLYTVDLPQRDVRQLTSVATGESDHSPAFSPDGSQIAYGHWGSQPGIWLVDADGSDPHLLAPVDGYASGVAWSPDGRSLVFAVKHGPFAASPTDGVYVVGADGSGLHRVAPSSDGEILDRPTWSPDGTEIEFTVPGASGTREVDAVSPVGTGEHVVLREPWSVFQPTWQPSAGPIVAGD